MARMKFQNWKSAVQARFRNRFSLVDGKTANTVNAANIEADWAYDNTAEERWRNAGNTDDVRALSVNASNQVLVAEGLSLGARKTITWEAADNGSISSQGFWISDGNYRVVSITWIHATQSSVAGTAYVEKTPSGTAIGSGTSLMSGTFDLHAIANNTLTTATLSMPKTGDSDDPALQLVNGDQLSVVIAGTITSLAGVQVEVVLAPQCTKSASYYMKANADMVQAQYFFTANRPYVVTGIQMRWSTKSSVSGLKLTVTKDTSTNAPGAGTSLLTDNTNAGVLVTQTANITYAGTLSTTAGTVRLATGDRLSIKFSGATLTALAGLVVTVTLQESFSDRVEKSFFLDHVVGAPDLTGITAVAFWTADRDYQIVDLREVHKTAGNDVGAVNLGVGVASGTTPPGSATIIQTDNSSKGFDIKGTAATVQVGTLAALGNLFLLAGDRLCVVPSGTFTTAVGVCITVGLQPR